MSNFSASASKSGTAQTSTKPPYTVNSTASATATSNESQSNAQTTANTIAQQVANSVAQNDANIISQTLALSPAGVLGTYDYLNISFAFQTSINGQAEYDGLIIPREKQITTNKLALVLTSNKVVYYSPNGEPIPNARHIGTLNAVAAQLGSGSILSCNRISSIEIPMNEYSYKLKIVTNLKISCSIPITTETTLAELQQSITGIQVNNKTPLYVNIVSNNGNLISSYIGVKLTEHYSDDYLWNTLSFDFTYAYPAGSSKNIYPVQSSNFPQDPLPI
jgi:hypothetical protein